LKICADNNRGCMDLLVVNLYIVAQTDALIFEN
jgi:hypothetical protein